MGKRSSFERRDRDYYPTPVEAVAPLLPFLMPGTQFIEPCAGDGRLVRHLEAAGLQCTDAYDVEPRGYGVRPGDALIEAIPYGSIVITNPPWDREFLHPFIRYITQSGAHAWLLFDADWAHTKQARPYAPYVQRILSIGRVKWIEGSKHTGKDNAAWYKISPIACNWTEFHFRSEADGREVSSVYG